MRAGPEAGGGGGGTHLFGEQDGGVAVLFAGLGAQRDEAEEEEAQAAAPDEQLPVVVTGQEGVVDVQQLEPGREGGRGPGPEAEPATRRGRYLSAADEDDREGQKEGGGHDDIDGALGAPPLQGGGGGGEGGAKAGPRAGAGRLTLR